MIKILSGAGERLTEDNGNIDFIYYDPATGYQNSSFGFDGEHKLNAKGYLAYEGQAENDLQMLLRTTFAGSKFEKIEHPLCGQDSYRPPFLVDRQNGIIIEPRSFDEQETESVFWYTPNRFLEVLDWLTHCHKSHKGSDRFKTRAPSH